MAERDGGIRVSLPREAVLTARTTEGVKQPVPGEHLDSVIDLEEAGVEVKVTRSTVKQILDQRAEAVTQVYRTLDVIHGELRDFFPKVPVTLPPSIDGRFLNPDGQPAAFVSVQALEPALAANGAAAAPWPRPETTTDARGAFRLALPPKEIPQSGLTLAVTGGKGSVQHQVRRTDLLAPGGHLGILPLEQPVAPLDRHRSVIAKLGDVTIPTSEEDVVANPREFAEPAPIMTLGEGDCGRSFRSNAGVIDRHGFSLLVRLVAPELSGRRLGTRLPAHDENGRGILLSSTSAGLTKYLGAAQIIEAMSDLATWELVQRVPVEDPIDVTSFREAIERNPKMVPKAATLGIGYVLRVHQIWIPTGLSLGDLVYSLPLAPGEQQRIAVSDTRETLSIRETEALTAEELQRYNEQADSSTTAVFNSAFNESASGGSTMRARTEAGSIGGGLGVGGFFSGIVAGLGIAGGYSDSTTSGSTSSWQKASRDYASSAVQDFHASLARQASARRRASRVAVRLATASEQQAVTTKVISNHNHCHALTMQYWEVLRHFAVSSKVDDVQLVCFVPLEVVAFLPAGQPRTLAAGSYSRDDLLNRYRMLLRYHDVIEQRVWWRPELAQGLRSLRGLAGNPTMTVQASSGSAQDIISVSVSGTFLPFEDVYVSAVSTNGARVGPVRLNASSPDIAAGAETRAALLDKLRSRRRSQFETRTGSLALPQHIARSELARFEFSRQFRTFSYRLALPAGLTFDDLVGWLTRRAEMDVTLTPADLEREVGGPLVQDPVANIGGTSVIEEYNGPGGYDLMQTVMPVAAKRLPPVLSFADLLRIEALLQHVVQNTVTYSRAVWESLTPEERAILLERYTVGVPGGGAADASQEVPLLNCVANQVLGYFGNCAVMPFFIPVTLADRVGFSSRDVQEALLKFHRQAFVPPQSSITLPARGVLGEAVLGSCNSCEKIDLTRFWNWQDSPGDTAGDPAQAAALFAGGNQLVGPAGAQAPSGLTTGPMVTINQGPTALTPAELAKALIEKMPESNLPQNLTGLAELAAQMKVQTETTSASLNKTISEASGLAKAAMEAVPKAIQAKNQAGGAGSGGGGGGTGGGGTGGGGTGGGGTGGGGTGGGGTGGGGGGGGSGGGGSGGGGSGGGTGGPIDGGAAPTG